MFTGDATIAAANGQLGWEYGLPVLIGLQSASYWLLTFLGGLLMLPLLAIGAFAVAVFILPREFGRSIVWGVMHLVYRIRVVGDAHVPRDQGALLVANHLSWLDGVIMLLAFHQPPRILVYGGNFRHPVMQRAGKRWGAIPISAGPKSILRSLKTAREAIQAGDLVGIFPEGGISRNGMMQGFKPGMMRILRTEHLPVIPVYVDGMWGSIFSFEGGKFFWKLPRVWRRSITIQIGEPMRSVTSIHQVRQAVQQLGAIAVTQRWQTNESPKLVEQMISACKKRKFESKIGDTTGTQMTGGQVLMRALILRRLLRRTVLADQDTHVGVLVPPSAGAVVTNMALSLDRRVAVNLNYTVSSNVMNQCIHQAGIKHVLTSKRVLDKLDLDINANLVLLEDLRAHLRLSDKIAGALGAYVTPASLLASSLRLGDNQPDDTMTLIFTSGSTGIPKGVMLTHANIRSNVDAINQVIRLEHRDVIVGILPFFHSFGYTVTLWTVIASDVKGIYHVNPLDSKQVGKLVEKQGGTILLSTPTFLRSYLRRCTPEQLKTLDTVVAGAEKLPRELCDQFEAKFGVRPVEGYGTTELSPLVSVNVPPSRHSDESNQVDWKEGTVGRCVAGVAAKVVGEDGQERGPNESGMLLISGPNVMKGYLNQPEKTAEVIQNGWYVTGDMAQIDVDGFITITGRQSRFSKIGGEMVPHLQIEERLTELVGSVVDGDGDGQPDLMIAVTSVADSKKGERLIVLHTRMDKTPRELIDGLKAMGLPNLFIPGEDSFFQVDAIPVLGTGKLDLRGIKETAERLVQTEKR